jgi:hypothetical protein
MLAEQFGLQVVAVVALEITQQQQVATVAVAQERSKPQEILVQ